MQLVGRTVCSPRCRTYACGESNVRSENQSVVTAYFMDFVAKTIIPFAVMSRMESLNSLEQTS